jgi:hypothetical protein
MQNEPNKLKRREDKNDFQVREKRKWNLIIHYDSYAACPIDNSRGKNPK